MRPGTVVMRRFLLAALTVAVVASACSESPDGDDASGSGGGTDGGGPTGESVVEQFAGEEWFLGEIPETPEPADPDAEPVVIGMINQEDTPLGSFPEIRAAVEAGVAWVNAELGGVGGRPVELSTCITSFDVEQSQACAQQMVQDDVVALVGGIDVTSNGSIPVLEANEIPQLGGIPANLVEQQSDVTFFFSGGVVGGTAAFLSDAAANGAENVVIAYGEFESFESAASDYGVPVADSLGLESELVTFPVTATDFLPVLTRAAESDPDAIIVLAAGTSCAPIMETYRDLGLDAQLYLVGACAAEEILEAAGEASQGVVFNSEGPSESVIGGEIFVAVGDSYAEAPAGGAGTVGLRSFLNLYAILDELGPDDVSRESVLELVRAAEERPSFWGHPYTCDGEQVAGLPSLCAPQQSLFEVPPTGGQVTLPDDIVSVSDGWIDTVTLFRDAL